MRCIFTGSSRVGKTSLKHFLLYDTAREDKTSTAVLEAPEVVLKWKGDDCLFSAGIKVGSSTWKAADHNLLRQLISEMNMKEKDEFPSSASLPQATALSQDNNNAVANSKTVDKTNAVQKDGLIERFKKIKNPFKKASTNTQTQLAPATPSPKHNALQLDLLDQAREAFLFEHNLSSEVQIDEEKCIQFIYLLDTGGQPSFQNVIPLLLDFPCNFIQVFKASDKLTDPYVNAYCPDGVTEEKRANSRSSWELMKESITAAYTMSMKSDHDLKAFEVENEPQLRLFVVGTHLSDLPESSQDRRALLDHNKKVLKEMDNKPYDEKRVFPPKEVVYEGASNYFLVDSQLKGDREHIRNAFNALRSSLSDSKYQLSLKVPKAWLCLQLITSAVEKKMWKFTELEEFCTKWQYVQAEQADRQLLSLLNLFHCLGFYVFYNMGRYKQQWVCTDATYLYKEMSKVLSVQYFPSDTPLSAELRNFKETGEIPEAKSEALFRLLGVDADIPRRWLLEVLVHVGIAAKVSKEEKIHYFIPVTLPEGNVDLSVASVEALGFTFAFKSEFLNQRYSCVPTGIFHILAVDIANNRTTTSDAQSDQPSKIWKYCPKISGSTQFAFSRENAHIVLSQKEDLIQLHLLIPQYFPRLDISLHELCKHIREEMHERISYVSKKVFGSKFLEEKASLEAGVICRNCKDSSLHLKRFEGDNVMAGLCTKWNKMTSFTLREAVWVSQEHGGTKNQVCCHA